ncbi:MAG: beta strand repeat-containing protein, partial [Flavobacteriia bacterium]
MMKNIKLIFTVAALVLTGALPVFGQCLTLTSATTTSACVGLSNGAINLSVGGGTGPYTYSWAGPNGFTSNNEDISGLTDGAYTCVVGETGCSESITVTIASPQVMTLEYVLNDINCFGAANGSITAVPSDGVSPYVYAWSNTASTQTINNLTPGNYSVIVTDNNGCKIAGNYIITQPPALQITNSQTNVLCFGQFNGTINTNVVGGTGAYQYAWSNGSNNQNLINLDASSYNLTVTDANGCTAQSSVTITQPGQLVATSTQVNVACFGQSTGSIDATIAGGTAPFSYSWTSGQLSEDISGLPQGNYTLSVTDNNGCATSITRTITQNAQIMVGQTITNVLCNGQSNGAINITASGGITPYSFAWSGPNGFTSLQEDLTGLEAGLYSLTLTDNLGCNSTNSYSYNVTQPLTLTASQTNLDILCFGGTGSIDLTVSGGTTPYTYSWSNGATTQDVTGLLAGDYSVVVTDNKGCTATVSNINIATAPAALTLSTAITNAQCYGQLSGAIDLTVTGGVAPYTYFWSNGPTTQDNNGISAGSYNVSVTDANNCNTNQTFIVTEPISALTVSETHTDVVCAGTATGTVNLTVSGGTGPYSFLWSNGLTIEDPTAIAAGAYTVTITDANSCTGTIPVSVAELFAPLSATTAPINVACFGGSNGFINLTVNGGASPYTYVWSNGGSIQDIGGLSQGTYSVTITDVNNCVATASAIVTQPNSAVLVTETNVDLLCVGYATGSVNATASGGTAPYTYTWTGPGGFTSSNEDLSGLTIGNYTLIVSDANNCTDTVVATINNPVDGLNIASIVTNVSCYDGADGAIDLTISGGTPGYVTLWSNGLQLQDLSNLTDGSYTVTVTDNAGCVLSQTFTITEPEAPLAYVSNVVPVLCYGDTTGAVTLTVTGGTTPYFFAWSSGDTTEDIYNLGAGNYSVTITDDNGCTQAFSGTVSQPNSAMSVTLYPTSALCFGTPTGSIDLSVAGGVPGYTYSWSNGQTSQDLTGVVGGQYTVTVQDANGCLYADTVLVNQPLSALTLTQATTNISCNG